MADAKLSALTAATTLNDADILYLVQSAVDKKITWATLKTLISAATLIDGSVSTAKLANGAVTNVKIADDNITLSKMNKVLLEDQTADPDDSTTTIDITSYGFTDPFVYLTNKADWGIHLVSVSSTTVVVGIADFGSAAEVKFDLLIIEK
jgi:hypothetical protein